MGNRRCCDSACWDHAQQRSLYRHALNALGLAARSGCNSQEARDLAERCAQMLREAESRVEELVEHR